MNKVLLMSHLMPPVVRGPSVIINRLFKCFPINSYTILTSRSNNKEFSLDDDLTLPCKYYYVNIGTATDGHKKTYFNILRKWAEVIIIVIEGCKIIDKEGCSKLIVRPSPTQGNFFLAAYLIHKICRKRLYVYFFDLFTRNQQKFGFEIFMKRLIEKLALRSAECVFVMSERLRDYYQVRYPGLKIKIIRHPIDRGKYLTYDEKIKENASNNADPIKIVFTGMIYEYQIDAIQNLAKAVKELNNVEFHIYTQRSRKYLERMGVAGENVVYCGCVTNRELIRIQKDADILFLPMSFHRTGTDADVIKTASPSKISEYLAAGRPILVHAPKDSYITWYARKYRWGMVVDRPQPEQLKMALSRLIKDKKLQQNLINNAQQTVLLHDLNRVFAILKEGLGITSEP